MRAAIAASSGPHLPEVAAPTTQSCPRLLSSSVPSRRHGARNTSSGLLAPCCSSLERLRTIPLVLKRKLESTLTVPLHASLAAATAGGAAAGEVLLDAGQVLPLWLGPLAEDKLPKDAKAPGAHLRCQVAALDTWGTWPHADLTAAACYVLAAAPVAQRPLARCCRTRARCCRCGWGRCGLGRCWGTSCPRTPKCRVYCCPIRMAFIQVAAGGQVLAVRKHSWGEAWGAWGARAVCTPCEGSCQQLPAWHEPCQAVGQGLAPGFWARAAAVLCVLCIRTSWPRTPKHHVWRR
jgi:hypothetical protein